MSDTPPPQMPPTAATPILPFEQLRDTGLLWLINATVFHPRGYALSLALDPATGQATGWQLLGDGKDRWWYDPSMDAEVEQRFQAARRILK